MSYTAYRRLLSNPRLIGIWAFGRKRNVWSNARDYTRQVTQPDTEVVIRRCEELRIVSDEQFFAVQEILAKLKKGPRGPKKQRELQLSDLVTDCYYCPHCKVRFYVGGNFGRRIICKSGDLCPQRAAVSRKLAVQAVCKELTVLLRRHGEVIVRVTARAIEIDAAGDESIRDELAKTDKAIASLDAKIDDLLELAGQGTDADRAQVKAKISAAQAERASLQLRRAHLVQSLSSAPAPITPDRVREILDDLTALLENAASGQLGQDAVYRAGEVFRMLVGGRINVHMHTRPGRTHRRNVSATFRPDVLLAVQSVLQDRRNLAVAEIPAEVKVWLKAPPRQERLAEPVHQLIDVEGLSFRNAAIRLTKEGEPIDSGNVWLCYKRYYEMIGQPVPRRPRGRPDEKGNTESQ